MHLYLRPLTSVVTTREAFHHEVRERDQSPPDLARALYKRLVTSDNLDLLMGVTQRYNKVLVHHTFGIPSLAKYAPPSVRRACDARRHGPGRPRGGAEP